MDAHEMQALIFRKTNCHSGRRISVSASNSKMRHLAYGRIVLNHACHSISFNTSKRETALICLSGEASVDVDGHSIPLARYDAVYIPRDSTIQVTADSSADIAEFSAEVANKYPLQVVRCADISADPKLRYRAGGAACGRELFMLLAKNIEAGRLLVGITRSDSGNWTSWPPHEHASMLEEIYVYFDMPRPAYGIQLVYQNSENPELAAVVRDGDAVAISAGYHPNVSVPGHPIVFVWALAAHREGKDRQFGIVNVEPDFRPASSPKAG